jgi:hypothetical protein
MGGNKTNIAEVSRQAANLADTAEVQLASGRRLTVQRLSWIKFEAVWAEIAQLLAALLAADSSQATGNLSLQLAGAPALVLKLSCLSSGLPEKELAGLPFDEVLSIATAALRLNFIESVAVRDFFVAVARLAEQDKA